MKLEKWPHLYALMLGKSTKPWRWQLVETAAEDVPVRALAQDDEAGGRSLCGVFAVGQTLSLQARVIEQVSPVLLAEVSERALLVQDAKERIEPLMQLAQRLTQRAYQHKRLDEYKDLQRLRASLAVVQQLLEATAVPGLEELVEMERAAMTEAKRSQPRSDAS